jgi:hypothetical protein
MRLLPTMAFEDVAEARENGTNCCERGPVNRTVDHRQEEDLTCAQTFFSDLLPGPAEPP